jgi:hypothetical protein
LAGAGSGASASIFDHAAAADPTALSGVTDTIDPLSSRTTDDS